MNVINIIEPYRHHGMWVFDDERVGLVQEPFVAGADAIIDCAVADIPDADHGFVMVFAGTPFPGHQYRLDWRRGDNNGNWYHAPQFDLEGWFCPALLKYFPDAPQQIFIQTRSMTVKHVAVEQYTEEWKRLRLGMPTASNFHLIITPGGKLVDSRERKSYLYRLVAERILNKPMPSRFEGNEWTERGSSMEDEAADALERQLGRPLSPGGFVVADNGRYGCSPDRLLREGKEAAEIKCPAAWTHIGHMIEGPGDKYRPQVQGQIMIGRFEVVHFWSYCPGLAPVHLVTLPDYDYISRLRGMLETFCYELDADTDWVRRHGNVEEIVAAGREGAG